jgi:ubiquinone/menaquinone biosynthesis C-methylase UbiE
MNDRKNRVCPVELAGSLDNRIRRWFQNPRKILSPYLQEGMKALDFGCGPGFFTIDMAQLVGHSGRVIAADLQQGMLDRLKRKIRGTELEERITLHKTDADKIGLSGEFDFILAFYMLHEIPDQEIFFNEAANLLNPGGQMLIVEPPFHVSGSAFQGTLGKAEKAGFILLEGPKVFFGKTALLKRAIKEKIGL